MASPKFLFIRCAPKGGLPWDHRYGHLRSSTPCNLSHCRYGRPLPSTASSPYCYGCGLPLSNVECTPVDHRHGRRQSSNQCMTLVLPCAISGYWAQQQTQMVALAIFGDTILNSKPKKVRRPRNPTSPPRTVAPPKKGPRAFGSLEVERTNLLAVHVDVDLGGRVAEALDDAKH